jgi:phosphatidylserine/phosphatidylglycerophosphate/cardiolipin synthase-like enzyme
MAKYLRTSGITAHVEDLIRNAKERLYIVSPYLKLSPNIKELLQDKEREKVEARFVFGKQELSDAEMDYLRSRKYVRLYFYKNLHAKCYLNEEQMVISSMNLYEFSQVNNKEMGILIERKNSEDRQVYEDAWKDVESLINNSQLLHDLEVTRKINERSLEQKRTPTGYCVRTGVEIPFNIEKPLSYEAYKVWSKHADGDYEENYCHFSGEPSGGETCVNKPILKKHWKRAKEAFNL